MFGGKKDNSFYNGSDLSKGRLGNMYSRKIYADLLKRQTTLEQRDIGCIMHEFGAFGKRPKVEFCGQ